MQTRHPQEQAPNDALFRYQVVSQVLTRQHKGEPRPYAIEIVSKITQVTVDGQQRRISKRSIYRWLAAYEEKGFEGLLPTPRVTGVSHVLPSRLLDFFKEQKEDDPRASIPELIRRAKLLNIVAADVHIDRTTVWRTLRHMGVNTRRRKYPKKQRDSRRFAYPHRMDMVLCDGKHFRAGPGRLKRVALFFLDDATRMVLGAVVGTAEDTSLFLHGLHQVIKSYGLMTAVFLDNGPGFISHDTMNVLRSLNILCIHGTRAYAQGHGKIEKFNQTVKEQALRHYDGNPEIDPDCEALSLRLSHYLNRLYNQEPHDSLAGETPWSRFHNDSRPLRFADKQKDFNVAFVLHEKRRVTNDNTVSIDSVPYEMPRGHAGTTVFIRRNTLNNTLSFIDQGRLIYLAPVNLQDNARAQRAKDSAEQESPKKHTRSSADIAFNKDMNPIVASDGGFTSKERK